MRRINGDKRRMKRWRLETRGLLGSSAVSHDPYSLLIASLFQDVLTLLTVYLASSHHGRGIMPATIRALIHEFMVPFMNAHVITGCYFEHNAGSRKVFEKNGFVFEKVIPDCFELPESKTGVKGKKIGIGFMRWTRTP